MAQTPQEKAKELVAKYRNIIMSFLSDRMKKENAKECAIIAVDEIINSVVIINLTVAENQFEYWEQVKEEINKL